MGWLLSQCKHYNRTAYPLIIQAQIKPLHHPFIHTGFSPPPHLWGSYLQ